MCDHHPEEHSPGGGAQPWQGGAGVRPEVEGSRELRLAKEIIGHYVAAREMAAAAGAGEATEIAPVAGEITAVPVEAVEPTAVPGSGEATAEEHPAEEMDKSA